MLVAIVAKVCKDNSIYHLPKISIKCFKNRHLGGYFAGCGKG